MILDWILNLDQRRRRLLRNAPPGPVADYLSVPFPDRNRYCDETEFLALDLETTGLEFARDEILSVGFVPVRALRLHFADSTSLMIRPARPIPPDTAVVHQIFDDQAASGSELHEIMPLVLRALAGKIMIAHHAPVEAGFLAAACQRLYGFKPIFPAIDTLELEKRSLRRREQVVRSGALRLGALRERYGLPRHGAHNALNDAIAVAELFLAQVAHRSASGRLRLGDVF